MFNPDDIQKDFPILAQTVHGKPLVYLDSAATSQKPNQVIDAISTYYRTSNANVHRGIHALGDRSTRAWHESRKVIATFFNADPEELVLLRNTTEASNMVAYTWAQEHVGAGDIVLTTVMDHHSNIVPWQEVCKKNKAQLEFIPILDDGTLDLNWLKHLLHTQGERVRLMALPHVSNTLGTINPIKEISQLRTRLKLRPALFVDGAQAAPHMPVDFHDLDVDFYAVSAHKMLGPMGIGAVLVKKEILNDLHPWLTGGGMIDEVDERETSFAENLEDRFTAGTPDVASTVGWAAACDYLTQLGMKNVFVHDQELVAYTRERLSEISQVTIVGPSEQRSGSVAFVYQDVHAHDVAQILDSEGVAVRSGHHCTMPLHKKMQWVATTRVSFNVYTTKADIDRCVRALEKVALIFKPNEKTIIDSQT